MRNLLLVAAGSGVGGALRFLLTSAMNTRVTTFPLGVLLVNVLGSFVFGVFVRYGVTSGSMSASTRLLITTGLCGGFTTFSAFSMDLVDGLEQGRMTMVTGYVMASLVLGVGALLAGLAVGRALGE